MEKINVWLEWDRNWDNAYKFFNSKGNAKTKAKLKKKRHDDFMNTFKRIKENLSKTQAEQKAQSHNKSFNPDCFNIHCPFWLDDKCKSTHYQKGCFHSALYSIKNLEGNYAYNKRG